MIPKRTIVLVLLMCVFGPACRPKTQTQDFQQTNVTSSANGMVTSKEIDLYFRHHPSTGTLAKLVSSVYQKRNFEPIWFPNGQKSSAYYQLHETLAHAYQWGLNPSNYSLQNTHSADLATCEVMVTQTALIFFSHISFGIVRTKSILEEQEHVFFQKQLSDGLDGAIETGNFKSVLEHLQPSFPQYSRLQQAASAIDFPIYSAYPFTLYDSSTIDPTFWNLFKQMGYDTDGLPKNKFWQSKLLASFQKASGLNVTGQCNFDTYALLLKDRYEWFKLLELNLERLRQNPPLPDTYVWVNIPSFKLEMVQNKKVIHTTRVVVGAPDTPTPILSGKISHIITYPSWNIPTSIIRNEIIPAMRRDSTYLEKKGYKVATWSGQSMPNSSVLHQFKDSEYLPYNVSQPSGADNALGTLKFLFNNSESIYLHDTNAKSYFTRQFRALSHGCVRVQDPRYLATLLLDSTSVNQMDKQLDNHTSGHIALKKEIGVCLRYITCDVLANGSLVKYNDVYRQDFFDRHRMETCLDPIKYPKAN
ncbi:MAG: L,D-transpeptidase family protein [Breznakibacter sp.]